MGGRAFEGVVTAGFVRLDPSKRTKLVAQFSSCPHKQFRLTLNWCCFSVNE